jgi:hypothetical protein
MILSERSENICEYMDEISEMLLNLSVSLLVCSLALSHFQLVPLCP